MRRISDISVKGKYFRVLPIRRFTTLNNKIEAFIKDNGGIIVDDYKKADYVIFREYQVGTHPEYKEVSEYIKRGGQCLLVTQEIFYYLDTFKMNQDVSVTFEGRSFSLKNINKSNESVISKYILGRGGSICEDGGDHIIYSGDKPVSGCRCISEDEFGYSQAISLLTAEKKIIANYYIDNHIEWDFRENEVMMWSGFYADELFDRVLRADDVFCLARLVSSKAFYEKINSEKGYSNPYTFPCKINEYIEKSIKYNRNDLTAWLLQYRSEHFDNDFLEAAEEDKSDLEFGMRDPYYNERFPWCNCLGEYITGNSSAEEIKNAKLYDEIKLGLFPQGPGGEPENIAWQVIKRDGSRIMLISNKALAIMRYNEERQDVTWETCTLRRWLNSDFVGMAFTEEEQELLVPVTINNDDNPEFGTYGGNATTDKVYILSINEVNELFPDAKARIIMSTNYSAGQKIVTSANGACWWFLRSPGASQDYAASVHGSGKIMERGEYVSYDINGIRPAIWIDTDKL